MIRLSIVIPMYNAEKYIDRCLSGLLKQLTKDDEVILINDSSIARTEEKCRYYEKKEENIICYTIPKGGPSKARNEGIKKAKGKYLIFLDVDDYIEDNYIEKMLENIENSDLVICGYILIKEYNGKKEKIKMRRQSISKDNIMDLLRENTMLNVLWNKIYHLDVIKRNNIKFDEEEYRGEDLLFNLDYIKNTNKKIYIIDDILYNYVMKNNGLNMGYKEKLKVKFGRTNKIYRKMIQISKKDKRKILFLIIKMYINHSINYLKSFIK